MHTRFELRDTRLTLLITSFFVLAFALNLFHHVQYDVQIEVRCSGVYARIHHISQGRQHHSAPLVEYVYYAKYVQTLVGVMVPVVVVAFLNVSLIYFLKRRELILRSDDNQKDFR